MKRKEYARDQGKSKKAKRLLDESAGNDIASLKPIQCPSVEGFQLLMKFSTTFPHGLPFRYFCRNLTNNMAFNITGTLRVKREEQVINDRFKKREFVLTDDSSQYPQFISFQLTQDKCSLLDSIKEGEKITVHFNLRGREWKSPQGDIKYFNTLEAWKIDRGQGGASSSSSEADSYVPDYNSMPAANDDLPF